MKNQAQTAILQYLRLDNTDEAVLQVMNDAEWKAALDYCDRYQLTLPLAQTFWNVAPPSVERKIPRSVFGP